MTKDQPIMAKNHEKMRYDNVRLEAADNGYVLSFTEYTPAAKNSESIWNSKMEVFTDDNVSKALARLKKLYAYNKSLKQ